MRDYLSAQPPVDEIEATSRAQPEQLYQLAAQQFGPALARLARGYEADPERCRDLAQEIHLALWRSFHGFHGRCSLRTWTYRVAHNTATSYVLREQRDRLKTFSTLDQLDEVANRAPQTLAATHPEALGRLYDLIHALKPIERQIVLLYLDGVDAASIGEITGLTPTAV